MILDERLKACAKALWEAENPFPKWSWKEMSKHQKLYYKVKAKDIIITFQKGTNKITLKGCGKGCDDSCIFLPERGHTCPLDNGPGKGTYCLDPKVEE